MNLSRTALTLIGLFLAGHALVAQSPVVLPPRPTPQFAARTEHRQARQQHRILQGEKSGELTPGETLRSGRQQARIHQSIVHAEADGQVTPHEARQIHHRQKVASHRIYRLKHNARRMHHD